MVSKKVWFFLLVSGLLFSVGLEKALAVPSKPQNFQVSELSACAATLTWNQPDDADYFQLSLNNETWTTLEGLSGSGDKNFNHTGLNPGSRFSYYLRACANVGGCSESEGPANVTLSNLTDPPSVPTNLRTLRWEANGGRVVLSWTPSEQQQERNAQFTGFQIRRSDDNNGDFNPQPIFSLQYFNNNNNTWSDAVNTDVSHLYKIKTYQTDQYCNIGENNQIRYSDNDSSVLIVPRKPAFLREAETNIDRTSGKFSWEDVENETNFILQVADNANFHSPTTYTFGENEHVSSWISFAANQIFYLRVQACNNTDNNSGCSDFTTTTYRSDLAGPIDLQLRVQSADFNANLGEVKLNWRDLAGARHQTRIYRKTINQQNFGEPIRILTEGQEGNLITSPPTNYNDQVDLYQIYDYEVRFYYPAAQRESAAGQQVSRINLNFVHQLTGWAWSSNFGWLSMNSNNHQNNNIPYGAYVDSDGLLWGYAWSSNAGWLSFNKADLSGCPSGTCEARFDQQTKTFSGWAKFIGANPNQGAWQGWLSLGELRNGQQQSFNNKIKNFFANLISLIFKR